MVDKQISLDPSSTRERQPLVDLQQKTLPSRQRDLTHDYKGKDYPTTGSIRNNFLFDRTKQMPMLQ